MFRVSIVILVTTIGLVTGLLLGLIGGAAIVEFGKHSCTGASCGDLVVRGILPGAAAIGTAMGLAKGMSLVTGSRAKLTS